jgi:hypothetical protein
MRTEVIFCPSCNNKLRVPEELMARPVQCPQCRATFLAPPPSLGPVPPPLPAPAEQPSGAITRQAPPEAEAPEPRRPPTFDSYDLNEPDRMPAEPNDAKVLAPAFVLLAVSALGMLLNAVQIVIVGFMPKLWKQAQASSPFMKGGGGDETYLLVGGFFFLVSLAAAFGSISMMKRRLYPLALLGSFAAIFNLGQCCCLLSAPVGIWALIVLVQPDVRASFK